MKAVLLAASLATATLASAQEWQDLGPTGGEITSILLDEDSRAYAVGGGFFRREANGESWQRLPSAPGRYITFGRDTLFSTGHDAHVYRSVDRGMTWLQLAELPELTFDAPAEDAVDEAILYAATVRPDFVRRLYRSTDDGQSWQPIAQGLPDRDFSYRYILRADIDVANVVFLGSEIYGVFVSVNAGEHWTDASAGLPCPGAIGDGLRLPCLLALEQARDATLYAGAADGRVYRSDDRAQTWQSRHAQPLGAQVVALAICGARPGDGTGGDVIRVDQRSHTGVPPLPLHRWRRTLRGGRHRSTEQRNPRAGHRRSEHRPCIRSDRRRRVRKRRRRHVMGRGQRRPVRHLRVRVGRRRPLDDTPRHRPGALLAARRRFGGLE